MTTSGALDRPILAFGMPRSGTTWLGKILDSHPDTLYRHEPDTWQRIASIPLFAAAEPTETSRRTIRDFVGSLPDMRADRVCGKRPIFPKSYASSVSVRAYSARSLLHKALRRAGVVTQEPLPPQPAAGARYRLAVKSIESLGRAGLFASSLPEARIVHIVRHPCGYVASVLRGEQQKRFGHNEAAADFELYGMACATSQGIRHGLSVERFRAMAPAERLAWRWVIYNEKASEELAGNPNVTTLYYEQLCAQPEPVARDLFGRLELDWHRQSQQFLAASTSGTNSDYYSVVKNPLESAWSWRRQLDPADVERVLAVVSQSGIAAPYLAPGDWNRAA